MNYYRPVIFLVETKYSVLSDDCTIFRCYEPNPLENMFVFNMEDVKAIFKTLLFIKN